MRDITGKEIKKEKLTTAEVISIAQCLNLAINLDKEGNDDTVKKNTKRFHRLKTELEQEFLQGNGKFSQ